MKKEREYQPPAARAPDCRMIDNEVYIGLLRELIRGGQEVSLLIAGGSMTPFLIHRRDRVILSPITAPLRRGDVVMYQRRNGQYVLHRIVGCRKDGTFVLCGDAQTVREYGIRAEQIFARVTAAERKGKWIRPGDAFWIFFAQVWSRVIPLRRILLSAWSVVRRVRRTGQKS